MALSRCVGRLFVWIVNSATFTIPCPGCGQDIDPGTEHRS